MTKCYELDRDREKPLQPKENALTFTNLLSEEGKLFKGQQAVNINMATSKNRQLNAWLANNTTFGPAFSEDRSFGKDDHVRTEVLKFTENETEKEIKLNKEDNKSSENQVKHITTHGLNCNLCEFVTGANFPKYILRRHMKKIHIICEFCEHQFSTTEEMHKHSKTVHQRIDGRWVCSIDGCLKSTEVKFRMHCHIQSVHQGKWYRCDLCDWKFEQKGVLTSHTKTHDIKLCVEKIRCTICQAQMKTESLRKHMKIKHSENTLNFCSKCEFSTENIYYLNIHERRHTERMHCLLCKFSTSWPSLLSRHMKFRHEGAEMFRCPTCPYKTEIHSHISQHMETHNERLLQCELCEYKGKSNKSLRQHMLRHVDPKYHCSQCEYKTYDRTNFKTHETVKHGVDILRCPNCDYQTKSKRSLRKHRESKGHLIN